VGANFRKASEYLATFGEWEDVPALAANLFRQACRSGFQEAGFSLLKLGENTGSRALRRLMLDILDQLSVLCQSRRGPSLQALSMSRFNQQTTTKPHRDGGPAESLLLLGYEPTPVASQLCMVDYSLCAHEMGLSPMEFLDRHNPMFSQGADLLADFTTELAEFDSRQFQILLINNSSAEYDESPPRWQGVLHQATIPHPRVDALRVVNSIQLTLQSSGESVPITPEERSQFLVDDALGRQYGRTQAG
jgi:hypothetical protein